MSEPVTPVSIRRTAFAQLFDLRQGHGLEIGPLAAPVVTRDCADVSYVDVETREGLIAHYGSDPSVDCDAIPELDFALMTPDGIQSLHSAVHGDMPFDWAVASHVVEHVPDLVGWFDELSSVLVDGGALLLVVPDRRFCFDILRPATTVGQVLQARDDRNLTPSKRAVFDHYRQCVTIGADEAWRGKIPTTSDRTFSLDEVLTAVRSAEEGKYVDSHVWTFTPRSFVQCLEDLGLLGLLDFTIETVVPTAPHQLEFYVHLTRLPRGTTEVTRRGRADAVTAVLQSLPDESMTPAHRQLAEQAEVLRDELSGALEQASQLAAHRDEIELKLSLAQAELARSREELAAVLESERWRVGRWVVGPLAWAHRLATQRHPGD